MLVYTIPLTITIHWVIEIQCPCMYYSLTFPSVEVPLLLMSCLNQYIAYQM